MSADEHVPPPTELALTVRPLPAELLNRFDVFMLGAEAKVAESQKALADANGLTVDSEAAFIMMDTILATAKRIDKANEGERLALTRPIDDFKAQFLAADRPAHHNYAEVIKVCTHKMSLFRGAARMIAEVAQREAERLLREEREAKEAEARKLEEKAAKLKTPAAAERLMNQADEIRQVAALMPESVALAASEPKTVASSVAEIWEVEEVEDMSVYLRWLADHPEWHCVLNFKAAEHNRLAKQFHSIGVPGLKFGKRDSFRSKPR